jgi:hypothetical protein
MSDCDHLSYAHGVSQPARTTPKPLDPPMVPFAVGGMVLWVVAALITLLFRDRLDAAGHGSWLSICVAGVLWGLPGLATMLVHDRNRRRRRASDSFKTQP